MTIIKLKYDYLLPLVIKAIYPDKKDREKVKKRLEDYGKKDYQPAPQRVRLAILKFAYENPENLDELVKAACSEYRDILYFAETPLSMELWGKDEDLKKEREYQKKDDLNYINWLEKLIAPQRKKQHTTQV